MEFGLTGCSAVAVSKLLGVRFCVSGLLLFLEGGDCILVTPEIKVYQFIAAFIEEMVS